MELGQRRLQPRDIFTVDSVLQDTFAISGVRLEQGLLLLAVR
jgi:hypothetical protein